MAQAVETTTILNAQPFWMFPEMDTLWCFQTGELGQTNTQTDRQTDKQTDATKRIISPASRSIKINCLQSPFVFPKKISRLESYKNSYSYNFEAYIALNICA